LIKGRRKRPAGGACPRFAAGRAAHLYAPQREQFDDQLAMTDQTWSLLNEVRTAEQEPLAAEFYYDAPSEEAARALARELEPDATQVHVSRIESDWFNDARFGR
jgi:hypothetical protein